MKKAMTGLLEPTFKEVRLGVAEVRDIFKVPKFGTIAGCMVTEGRITRAGDTQARLLRDNVVIYEGKIGSLRRFKDDVSEVKTGFECGIGFEQVQRHQGRRHHRGLHDGAGRGLRIRIRGQEFEQVRGSRRRTPHLLNLRFWTSDPSNPEPRMSQGSRPDRVADQIRSELALLLAREVHDPGIGFVTLTRVQVSPDLQLARVYYTVARRRQGAREQRTRARARHAVPPPPDRRRACG